MENMMQYLKANWQEIVVMGISLPIVGFFLKKLLKKKEETPLESTQENKSSNSNVATVNFYNASTEKEQNIEKEKKIENLRPSVSILFIDDDIKFKVISILKNSGWIQTKIVRDLKNLNELSITNAHIVFVDIQGVGKQMGFTDDGLGLAASIKKKYPKKKVIIYSADSEGSRFHEAFRLADDQLSKNAVPYEFESVIETMTSQLIQDGIL